MKMKLPFGINESGDDRGVSPVVGVALLIAITVILAAVIGFVVLDTSTSTTEAENARLDFDDNGAGTVTVSHEGGDSFEQSNLVVKDNGTEITGTTDVTFQGGDSTVTTGDEFTVSYDDTGGPNTITVLWDDPESDRTVQLGEFETET